MGYGATPTGKRRLFSASRLHIKGAAPVYKTATVDLAAMFRKLVPFDLDADFPPFKAVSVIFFPAIHQFRSLETVVLCFDSPHLVPEMRKTFHAERRYAKSSKPPGPNERHCPEDGRNYTIDKYPASAADIEGLTMHSMPKWWPCYWNSARGKFALWRAIEASIKEYLLTGRGRPGVRYIIDAQDGSRWEYPAAVVPLAMPALKYGEGDMKSIMWATHLQGDDPVLVMTIDWDVILAVSIYAANVHVWIGTVYANKASAPEWYDEDLIKLTRSGGHKLWGPTHTVQLLEIIEMPRLQGSTRAVRLHAVMLALCCGGVDYCYGLKKYGFSEANLIPVALRHRNAGFPIRWLKSMYNPGDPYRRYLRFDPAAFIRVVGEAWRPRSCKSTLADLSREILNMLYCLTYFNGFDSQRTPGGPPPPEEIDLFPGMTTIAELLAHDEDFPEVVLVERYPADSATLPHDPAISYDGTQLDALSQMA